VIVALSENLRVIGTEHAWELQRPRKGKGGNGIEWRSYKYFGTLSDAVRSAAQAEIRLDPANSIIEALEAVNRVTQKYERMIDAAADGLARHAEAKLRAVA
jgi:hypothetical protein